MTNLANEFAHKDVGHLTSEAGWHFGVGQYGEAAWRLLDAAGLCFDMNQDAGGGRPVGLFEFTGRGYRCERRSDNEQELAQELQAGPECARAGCMGIAKTETYPRLCVPCAEGIELSSPEEN